ncbi:diguanylate cyclase (GGDEF) domain-containing protein [Pseudoxanthomonas sp. GM95]|uniref:ligand-binding sensor domain-containing diguanylate cyclase n=1 Tax=Pseudoxanthomonas sp. GM95 TaxID=1881043 RepID=UPI0008C0D65A|nr:ligand-binding sensor domain-containing diguanylate cyclase [Pseudoxanthomonas sp. GM95]SEL65163.1 diguanylate cyclase (GGDEF) domain-containing protein [Pseudoxanthomonas sp. GM95]
MALHASPAHRQVRGSHWLLRALLWTAAALSLPAQALEPDKRFQDYVTTNWSLEQGLPQLSVTALAQDATGYVWMGTQAGLARFDGTQFTTFDGHAWPGLNSGDIRALLPEPDGRLWIGTGLGLAVREHATFRQLDPLPAPDGPFEVTGLTHDAKGRVLVASSQGVYVVDGDHLTRLPQLEKPATALLNEASSLWVGGIGRVQELAADGKIRELPLPDPATTATVHVLLRAQEHLWAGTSVGLYVLRDGRWQLYSGDPLLARAPVEAMLLDRDDNLWIAAADHLLRLRDGQVTERVTGDPKLATRSLMEDREGDLWLGTVVSGATRVWNGGTRRYSTSDGLADPLLWAVGQGNRGQIWVASNDGVALFDHGRFSTLIPGRQLPHPAAYSLLIEQEQAWIGTRAGVAVMHMGKVERPAVLAPMDGSQINGIVRDPKGPLWFATTNGLFRLQGEVLTRYGIDEGLADPRVRVLAITHTGRLLVGTYTGLYEWRNERLMPLGRDRGFPADTHVTAIHELADGQLLVGNLSRETLLLFDGQRWTELGQDRGLPANPVFVMAADAHGQLWVGGLRGIYRFPLTDISKVEGSATAQLSVQQLLNERGDRHGGQKGDCCNGAGNARGFLQDGAFWLPTRDGLVAMDTERDHGNPLPPTPLVERVQVQGQWRDVEAGGDWTLPAQARDLRFEFTALTFQAPEHTDIRYRLRGYDANWLTLENINQRSVNYTNLPAGKYTFEVIGVNNSGVQSAKPAQLAFEIHPFFYEQWWFRLAAGLAVLLLIALGYGWLSRRYARQRAELEALVQQRTRDLRDANERLEALTVTDPLTGLHNRRYLGRQIPLDLAFYDRDIGVDMQRDALMFGLLDLDHFKRINDTFGHDAGDRVLQQVAQCLRELTRKGDYVVRWGGEEFLLVFRPMPRAQLHALGDRVCRTIAQKPFDLGNGQAMQVTVSLGLMEYPPFPDAPQLLGWEQMVALADRALYHVKANGRNGWAAYRRAPGATLAQVQATDGQPAQLIEAGLLVMVGSEAHVPAMPAPL